MRASTSVHSNAFNFRSYVDQGVDPRTGQYTVSLSLPALSSHSLAGPELPLSLGFSPLNTRDAGFGRGWGMNLTEYDPETHILSLGTGETFKVTGSGEIPHIAEKKLDTFHFHDDGGGVYRVVHKSGMVEILRSELGSNPLALPAQVLGPDGRSLHLDYMRFQDMRRLATVSDGMAQLLHIERNEVSDQVTLNYHPGKGANGEPFSSYILHLDANQRVIRIVLPTTEEACWRLGYETHRGMSCISEIWTPTGAHEIVEYRDGGHPFPGAAHPALPRVTRHLLDPGCDQPQLDVRYTYSQQNNFLGYGELSHWADDGLDNLYKVADASFQYWSEATLWADGKARRAVKRIYNRFHLMTEEATTQGACRKRVITTYYADHPDNRQKPFAEQPAQCQLPWSVETRWDLTDDAGLRTTLSETRYDESGNLTLQANPDGTREEFTYYTADGEDDLCPPDPERFQRNIKSSTVFPAQSAYGAAPVLCTERTYLALPSIEGSPGTTFLAEREQKLSEAGGKELRRQTTTYHEDTGNRLLLGRIRSVSDTLNQLSTLTEYQYRIAPESDPHESLLEIEVTTTGFDGSTQTVVQRQSTLNGQVVFTRGLDGVEVRHTYDRLNRLTSEVVAPGTAYQAERSYEYHLIGEHDDGPAWQVLTDVRDVQTKTRFDGLSRPIHEERQDVDSALAEGLMAEEARFRPTYSALHDALGQRVQETSFDWLRSAALSLSTGYEYDDWGERMCTIRSDGVREVTEVSPFGSDGPVEHRWLESTGSPAAISDRRVSWFNRFGKPERIEHLDDHSRPVFTVEQRYDGLGQCVESHEISDLPERVTYHVFDAWRRIVATTLPDGTTLHYGFAPHSYETLAESVTVRPANAALPTITAGTQKFDGLDRLVERKVGSRKDTFTFAGGGMQPLSRTLPSGTAIAFDYVHPLGDAPLSVTARGEAECYRYDEHSGALVGADNTRGKRDYSYAFTGRISQERWTSTAGAEHVSDHTLSRQGRALQRVDTGPGTQRYSVTTCQEYDDQGRVKCITQGAIQVDSLYDDFGRPWTTTTSNSLSGQTLVTTQTYDSFSRETKRTLQVGGQLFTVTQSWRADSQLSCRDLDHDGRTLLHEEFHYDRRNRLQRHVCQGEQLPQDRFGNAIKQQVFTYDAIENVTLCLTTFADGRRNVADYTYAEEDPCQLIRIEHRDHPDYPSVEQFQYDEDGNLLNDGMGRELRYDALGRLLAIAASGEQMTYHYDGHGELVSTTNGSGDETLRFHEGFQLHHEVRSGRSVHVLHANDAAVCQSVDEEGAPPRLLLTNAIGSVIAAAQQEVISTTSYSAYGVSDAEFASLLGFNGERRESSGWYLLGRGYRAYCPALMRFNRPDSDSPFGDGGLNPYAYCEGNPVTFRDRNGHRRELPEYIYPPPPAPEPQVSGGGGGWMKWLGVAISAVFLVVAVVSTPWSMGLSAPLVIASLKGIALQTASIGMQVGANLVEDPTLQLGLMLGGMAVGIYGGMVSAKASAAASAFAKQQKLLPAGINGKLNAIGEFTLPKAQLSGSPGASSLGGKATRHVDLTQGGMPAQPWTATSARAPAPQNFIPRTRLPAKIAPLRARRYADVFSGPNPGQSTFWMRTASAPSPVMNGFIRFA